MVVLEFINGYARISDPESEEKGISRYLYGKNISYFGKKSMMTVIRRIDIEHL